MALGLNSTVNGDFIKTVQWNAKAGRMELSEREQVQGRWETVKVDVTGEQPAFAADFPSITVGWQAFVNGKPDFHMVPLGQDKGNAPSPDHKLGLSIKLYNDELFGGVRMWSSSAKTVTGALDELHEAYLSSPEAGQGLIPVVKLTGSQAVVTTGPSGKMTNYRPKLTIVGWTRRPDALGTATAKASGFSSVAVPAAVATSDASLRASQDVGAALAASAQDKSKEILSRIRQRVNSPEEDRIPF